MQAKKETTSQYVNSFRGGLMILSGISHQNHWPGTAFKTQQGRWCCSSKLFTSLLPTIGSLLVQCMS